MTRRGKSRGQRATGPLKEETTQRAPPATEKRREERAPNSVQIALNNVAARVIALEPENNTDWDEVAFVFEKLARDPGLTGDVRSIIQQCAYEMAAATTDTAARSEAIQQVYALLEEAMRPPAASLEEGNPVDVPSSDGDGPLRGAMPATLQPAVSADAAQLDHGFVMAFVNECREFIEEAEAALLRLEAEPQDAEAINRAFRAIHTIKGNSEYLPFADVTQLTHHTESLLSRLRDREMYYGSTCANLCLRALDMLRGQMDAISQSLHGDLTARALPAGWSELLSQLQNLDSDTPAAAGAGGTAPRKGDGTAAEGDAGAGGWVRVRTDNLDRLIDMVGELVIAQSLIAQDETVLSRTHNPLLRKVTQAGKIVRELQDLSMSMRMVTLKKTFQKAARMVRDTSVRLAKQVQFHPQGDTTEIDRQMVDRVADPLLHMVRNAIDHGIESSADRLAGGKDASGHVYLRAYHAGGNVVIELEDDGQGLDPTSIKRVALQRGLIDSDKGLSDVDAYNMIFVPGFSTAQHVTELSGRGVGMDVVKSSIEALRGRIEIDSKRGRGTRFTIRLPLTMAITDGMVLRVGTERYIMPTIHIQMSFRPSADMLSSVYGRGEMVMLRGELLPILRLHRLFGVQGAVERPQNGLLVAFGEGQERCALLVDELLGQLQVVAKSLGEGLGHVVGISGCAILGDGRVGLILDPSELAMLARGGDAVTAEWSEKRSALQPSVSDPTALAAALLKPPDGREDLSP